MPHTRFDLIRLDACNRLRDLEAWHARQLVFFDFLDDTVTQMAISRARGTLGLVNESKVIACQSMTTIDKTTCYSRHHCDREHGHQGEHTCECGETWTDDDADLF